MRLWKIRHNENFLKNYLIYNFLQLNFNYNSSVCVANIMFFFFFFFFLISLLRVYIYALASPDDVLLFREECLT